MKTHNTTPPEFVNTLVKMDTKLLLPSLLLLLLLSLLYKETEALIPKLCVHNVSRVPEAVCCPIPPGFSEPCGGPGRGRCEYLEPTNEDFSPRVPQFSHDNRLDWPRRWFTYACQCEGNFIGYMCQECQYGYRGHHCTKPHMRVRKDALTLSEEEKAEFRKVVNKAKHTVSEWMVPTGVYDMDTQENKTFVPVTVYDFIVYQHVFAARQTTSLDGRKLTECKNELASTMHYDFAHNGMAFLAWHRQFLLLWERLLQQLSGNQDFTIPYWDWVGVGNYCAVCVNDLVGAPDPSSPEGFLQTKSPFHDWVGMCQEESDMQDCRYCDPLRPGRRLRRNQVNTLYPTAPSYDDLAFTQQFTHYDRSPYGVNVTNSFRNSLEGFLSRKGLFRQTGTWNNHNVIHAIFNGNIFDVTTSPNDPLFILLHNNVDRLMEIWLRAHPNHVTQISDRGAPVGHNLHAPLVPFFPRVSQFRFQQTSLGLGYDFDTLSIMARTDPSHKTRLKEQGTKQTTKQVDISHEASGMTSGSIAAIVLTITLTLIVIMGILVYRRHSSKTQTFLVYHEEGEPLMK